ncbi:unnamed protein product, partial [Musa banksii]
MVVYHPLPLFDTRRKQQHCVAGNDPKPSEFLVFIEAHVLVRKHMQSTTRSSSSSSSSSSPPPPSAMNELNEAAAGPSPRRWAPARYDICEPH